MPLLGEDGKPVEVEMAPTGEAPDEPAKEVGQPDPDTLPRIEIRVQADGNLSIVGPNDPRLVLRMLHEATDLIVMGVVRKGILDTIGASGGVQRPGLRDVLNLSKLRPR